MSLSYEYSIGAVRAKEASLLSSADTERMAYFTTEKELVSFLKEKGMGEGNTAEEIADNYMKETFNYLRSLSPDPDVFSPFFFENDLQNAKAVLKSVFLDRDYKDLIASPYNIEPDLFDKAIKEKDYSLLPSFISEPFKNAYKILAESGDGRLSDGILDKAVMEEILSSLKEEFLKEYFTVLFFYAGVKIALRSADSADRYYLEKALPDGEGLYKERLMASALKGKDALLELLNNLRVMGSEKAAECYRNSFGEFEKFTDNLLMEVVKKHCKFSDMGAAPLMGYYLAVKNQCRAIRIAGVGIRNNRDSGTIKERLRKAYD